MKKVLKVAFKIIIALSMVFLFGTTLFLIDRGMYGHAIIFGILAFAHLNDNRNLFG